MRIAIVGAGIGGLSAAVGLRRAGAAVTVFERADAVRAGGSGLSLFANGLRALDALALRDALEGVTDRGVEGLAAGQRTADGSWLMRVPTASVGQLRIVDRADLHQILLAALEPAQVTTGVHVSSARPDGRVELQTGSNEATAFEQFDLVVGADGLHSRVRSAVAANIAPRYRGYSAWRGITSVPADLGGAAGESIELGRRFGIAPLADGRVYWFAVANMAEDAVVADEKATVAEMFAAWHSPIPELIATTPAEAIRRTGISDLARPLPRFHAGRVVLLGDAAHAMTPNLGQGGGQALEDAATLTALLEPIIGSPPDANGRGDSGSLLELALRRYDALRRGRTQSIAAASRVMGTVLQLDCRPLAAARNVAMRATPARLLADRAAAVQQWAPPAS